MSVFVALVYFMLVITETVPATSLVVPLIGAFLLITMFLVTLSIMASSFVQNLHYRDPEVFKVPKWMKNVFCKILPRFLLMPPQKSVTLETKRLNQLTKKAEVLIEYDPTLQKVIPSVQVIGDYFRKENEVNEMKNDWKFIVRNFH